MNQEPHTHQALDMIRDEIVCARVQTSAAISPEILVIDVRLRSLDLPALASGRLEGIA